MRIVGFHSGHDCAYCILEDGVPIIHEELERINRIKQTEGDSIELYMINLLFLLLMPAAGKGIYKGSFLLV